MKEEELKRLLSEYYDGTASESDEQELREYFASGDVMPGYETEQEIFSYYLSGDNIPEPEEGFEERIISAVHAHAAKENAHLFRRVLLPSLSAAAGILIITGLFLFLNSRKEPADTFNDPKLAYAETLRILVDVSSKMNHAKSALQPIGKMDDIRVRSLNTINRSTALIGKNLKPLEYLSGTSDAGNDKQ